MTVESRKGEFDDFLGKSISQLNVSPLIKSDQELIESSEGPVNTLSNFIYSEVLDSEKERQLVAACSHTEFKQSMKKLFVQDFTTLVGCLEILHASGEARKLMGWILLRVASDWPGLMLNYLDELDSDNERCRKWNFLFSLLSVKMRRFIFQHIEWTYGPEVLYSVFLLTEDSRELKILLDLLEEESVSEKIDGMIIYFSSLERGTFKQFVGNSIKKILLEYGEYELSLAMDGKLSPAGYLFANQCLEDRINLIEEFNFGFDLDFWCERLEHLWTTDYTTKVKCGAITEVLETLSIERIMNFIMKAYMKNPHLLCVLCICCPLSKLRFIKRNYPVWLSKMVKISSSTDVNLYEYIADWKDEHVKLLKPLQPLLCVQPLSPFFVGLYMISAASRTAVLKNISKLDSAQLHAAAAAWPSSKFLSEFISVEEKISINAYEAILKHCSSDNLEAYLSLIGRQVSEEYITTEIECEDYTRALNEYLAKSKTDIKIWRYLRDRYFEVTKKLRFFLKWNKVPIMMERSVVLYHRNERVCKSYDFLSIQRIYDQAKTLLNSIPLPEYL